MGGLLTALSVSAGALNAYSGALNVESQNVANASTPGYAAVRASIVPIGADSLHGTDYVQLSSAGSAVADALVQAASSRAGASQTLVSSLTPINSQFDVTGQSGILAALQNFGTAFAGLAVSPSDSGQQTNALEAAQSVANSISSTVAALDQQQSQVDTGIQSTVSQINTLASTIASLNSQTAGATTLDPGTDAELRSSLDSLSSLVDITTVRNTDGTTSVFAGGSVPLVLGSTAFQLSADPSAAAGSQITSSGGGAAPSSYSGQLGALLDVRDNTIASLIGGNGQTGSLNTLASAFATRVNSLLTSGQTATGAAGTALFTFDNQNPQNAARTLAITANFQPSAIATASAASSNGIANTLAQLPESTAAADQVGGTSAINYYSSVAAGVGTALSSATTSSSNDQTSLTSAQTSRQQQSGVNLDQEAVTITGLERAWQASAQVVTIIDQITSDEMSLIK